MLANNNQRLNIWLKLEDKFDYATFAQLCQQEGCVPLSEIEFASKTGLLGCAVAYFPLLSPMDAYMLFVDTFPPVGSHMISIPVLPVNDPPAVSQGLGDTIAKITHATGLDKLSEMYTNITGKPCGCADRQEALNRLFPYGIKE